MYTFFVVLFSDEPIITHGLTLTSKIRFRDVVQVIRVSLIFDLCQTNEGKGLFSRVYIFYFCFLCFY